MAYNEKIMRERRLWIEIAIVVVVAVAAFFAGRYLLPAGPGAGGNNNSRDMQPADAAPQSLTRQEVPPNTTVPEPNEDVPQNVAKPEIVIPAAPGVDSKKRIFKIAIDGNKFMPDTIVVDAGDITNVAFTAVDKEYDLVQPDYGFKGVIAKGESKVLEGQFNNPGKYTFYCSSCGGPDAGPVGYLIVLP